MKAAVIKALVTLMGLAGSSCRHTETSSVPMAQADEAIRVDSEILETQKVGWTALSDYVAMNIPFAPIVAVKKQVESRAGVVLQSRGEAHITVVTPPELSVLRTRLSLQKINGLVDKMAIQRIPIRLQCLGRAQLKEGNRQLATYFLVVQAPGLGQIREKLRQQFVAAGGDKQAFAVEKYYPHITVGFTDRDLYEVDGVMKDSKSCLYKVE